MIASLCAKSHVLQIVSNCYKTVYIPKGIYRYKILLIKDIIKMWVLLQSYTVELLHLAGSQIIPFSQQTLHSLIRNLEKQIRSILMNRQKQAKVPETLWNKKDMIRAWGHVLYTLRASPVLFHTLFMISRFFWLLDMTWDSKIENCHNTLSKILNTVQELEEAFV